ncbi:MAG: cation diffusion facilitator family transporter [Chitinophagaceae bacterium]
METRLFNLRIQKWIISVAVLLFAVKMVAYFLTRSVSILTDALESTVNVIAGLIGLYSLYVSAKPKDENHPYGHGKAEFISAAVEGTLIGIAGMIIIYESIHHLVYPQPLQQLNYGIALIVFSAVVNFIMGQVAVQYGKKNDSLALIASGKHLKSDTYSTIGIVAGLVLIYYTGILIIDSIVAMIFGLIIIFTGYRITRSSIAGIMDEADKLLLTRMVALLNSNRRENWVDLHNLRVIKYGSIIHVDCHLTVPWYFNINQAHIEVEALSQLIRNEFGEAMELFVHSDGCLYSQCSICSKHDCLVRQHPFEKKIIWTLVNILSDKKHQLL